MGIADRDYIRTKRRGYDGPGGPTGLGVSGWSFTVWLIVVNIGVFVLDKMVFRTGIIERLGHFSTAKAFFFQTPTGQIIFGLEFWRFITFQFLHANFLHIFFNMLALWIFGPLVEARMGFKRYAAFYLVCGVFGALLYLALNLIGTLVGPGSAIPGLLIIDSRTPLVGASAGVFGVLMAAAYYRPDERVILLFPPIPIRLKVLAYGYVAIAAISLLLGSANAGGEAAHIGGAVAGYFFVRNSHLLHDFFDVFGKSPPPPDSPRAKARKQRGERMRAAAKSKKGTAAPSDAEIDRILAKVATEGLQSLTASEKQALERASKDKRSG